MSTKLSQEHKEGIRRKLLAAFNASGFPSRAKYAVSIGISGSDLSNIENGKWRGNDRLLSMGKWMRIAREVGYEFNAGQSWQTAETATFRAIRRQLEMCAKDGMCAMFCDEAGLGKTHAVREFCANTPDAFYINGGSHPRKTAFIRALATAVGINPDRNKLEDVLLDTMTYLKSLPRPVLVIDEAGDLDSSTYLLLKRLYNELEFQCGIYMVGARGLKKRIDSAVRNRTNGFEEVFSRFGGRFTTVLPQGAKERLDFLRQEALMVAEANGLTDKERINRMFSRDFDLRTVRREVLKSRNAA
jgi:hypothetical protein